MADNFSLKAILSAVDRLSPVLKYVQSTAKTTRKYLGDLGSSVNGLASKFGVPLGIVSTIAAGFGIASIKKAVVDFADLGEEVQKGALKAGMSNAEFQKMKYVADQAGLPIESLEAAMGKLNRNMGAAGMGKNAGLVGLLKTLHIPLRDAQGQIRNAAELLPQLADAFVKNKDPVKQAAIGTALFGKAYQEMLPFLSEGSQGIEESLSRFDELRGVIGDQDLDGAKKFGDKLKDLSAVAKGFQLTIAKELVPAMTPMLESFIKWAAANKKLVAGEVKKVVQDLVAGIKSVDWNAFVQGIRNTIDAIKGAVGKVGGLRNALIILALIMNAQTIVAVFGLAGAFFRLGFAAKRALAGVAADAAGAGGKIGLIERAAGLAGTAFGRLRGLAAAAVLAVQVGGVAGIWSAVTSAIGGAGRAVLLFGRAFLFTPLGLIIGLATAAFLIWKNWDAVKGWLVGFFTQTLPYAVGYAVGYVTTAFSAAWTWIGETAGAAFTGIVGWLVSLPGKAMEVAASIGQFMVDLWNNPQAAIERFVQGIKDKFTGVFDWIKDLWGKIVGIFDGAGAAFKAGSEAGSAQAAQLGGPAVVQAKQLADVAVPQVAQVGKPALVQAKQLAAVAAPQIAQVVPSTLAPSGVSAAAAPAPLRPGVVSLNTPQGAAVNSKVEVSFKNAPPGMTAEPAKSNSPRVPVSTNVGYRTLGTGMAF